MIVLMGLLVGGSILWMAGQNKDGEKKEAVSADETDYHTMTVDGKTYRYNTSRVNFLFVGVDGAAESMEGQATDYHTMTVDGKTYRYNTSRVNFLFVGVDGAAESMEGQADVIFLVSCDRASETMDIFSFSRDSMVPIKVFDAAGNALGWERQHLGLAYSYGDDPQQGCLLTADAVSRCMNGIPIIYYTAANLSSITEFQNLVGELTVTVPVPDLADLGEEYEKGKELTLDASNYTAANLSSITEFQNLVGELTVTVPVPDLADLGEEYEKGKELTLDASNVEVFLRSRDTETAYSNSSRMERQRVYVEAYVAKLKQQLEEDFQQMVEKILALSQKVATNVSLDEISPFSEMFLTYSFSEENYHVVPGTNQEGMFHDEYIVDEEALQTLLLDTFYIEETE